MGAPGAGAPMRFLSGTHTKSHFALKCSLCYRYNVHIGIEHPFTESSSYTYEVAIQNVEMSFKGSHIRIHSCVSSYFVGWPRQPSTLKNGRPLGIFAPAKGQK